MGMIHHLDKVPGDLSRHGRIRDGHQSPKARFHENRAAGPGAARPHNSDWRTPEMRLHPPSPAIAQCAATPQFFVISLFARRA